MGLVDAFAKEDRVELTISQLIKTLDDRAKLVAENNCFINAARACIPWDHALIMTGYKGADTLQEYKKEENE